MIDAPSSGPSPTPFTDALQASNETLLNQLYTGHFATVQLFVQQNNGSADDARDIYQEAFLAVWRNVRLKLFAPANEQEYGAYLYRVAKNKWIDQLRARKVRVTVALDAEDEIPDYVHVAEDNIFIDAVKKQYAALGASCRELLALFYFQKVSLRAIAERFSWTEASAKNNKYRCLKQLREMVHLKGK